MKNILAVLSTLAISASTGNILINPLITNHQSTKQQKEQTFGSGVYHFAYNGSQSYTQSMKIGDVFQQISQWIHQNKITNFQLDRNYFVLLNSPTFGHFAQQQFADNILTKLETILKGSEIKVLDTKVTMEKTSSYSGRIKFIMTYQQDNQIKNIHLQPFPEDQDIPASDWYFGITGGVLY